MSEPQLSQTAQQWVNVILIWVGLGTLAGLLARSLIPGREPASAVAVVLIGIVGSVIGPLVLCHMMRLRQFNPIGPLGFLASVGGALALLVAYRLLAGLVGAEPPEPEDERGS